MTGLDNGLDIVSQVVEDGGRTNNGDPAGIQFLFFSMKCERCIAPSFAKTANKYQSCGFRKGRGTRGQIANICWIMEKAREMQKKHLFLLYWLCQSL